MSEFDMRDNPWNNPGFTINQSYSPIWLDLYRLLTCFSSSKTIALQRNDIKYELLNSVLRNEFEYSEISRILINLAAIGRNNLDNGNHTFDFNLEKHSYVGDLEDLNSHASKKIDFRQACNKIIHCEFINWDVENPETLYKNDGLNPIVYIYGIYNKSKWKITLNVYDFIVIYIQLIQV
jgi:hypothetical protein